MGHGLWVAALRRALVFHSSFDDCGSQSTNRESRESPRIHEPMDCAQVPLPKEASAKASIAQDAGQGKLVRRKAMSVRPKLTFSSRPIRAGYLPVRIAARDGEQIGAAAVASVNNMPSSATRSRCGVAISRTPVGPMSP